MSDIATKLTYLGETKSILKDTINMSNANITNSTTFRNYATQLKEGYIDILNNGTDTLYNNFTHLTGKGMTLSFAPTYQAPMKISCYGSTSQASTPTPSSPVDVVNTTGNQSISVCGKNLFDENYYKNASYTTDGYNYTTARIKGNRTLYVQSSLKTGKTAISGLYVCLCSKNNSNATGAKYGWFIYGGNTNRTSVDFTDEDTLYFSFYPTSTNVNDIFENYNLWVSTDDITYEAYNGTNYNIGLGNIELCKIGDYEDKIDKSTGKNLLSTQTNTRQGYISSTGVYTANIYNIISDYIKVTPSETYTLSYKEQIGVMAISEYDTNKTFIQRQQASNKTSNSFTLTSTTKYIIVGFSNGTSVELTPSVWVSYQPMLNKGDTALPYEPYGTDWYLKKNIGKVVLDGSSDESYSVETINDLFRATATYFNNLDILNLHTPYICNRLTYLGLGLQTQEGIANSDVVSANRCFIYINPSRLTESTLTAFRTWLSNNNLEIYFQLATPTYTKITDSTLIEQLEAIKSKDNTTNITSSMVIGAIALKKE